MDDWSEIRRRVLVEGVSQRQILRERRMYWRTLQKILAHSAPPGYRQAKRRVKRKLGDYLVRIEQIWKEDQAMPRKQGHTAKRIWERLRDQGWTSSEHFTADGTLIEAWASLKSFGRKDGQGQEKTDAAKDDDPGNPSVNFRGEKRTNQTHQSTTDPESVLYRKSKGQESKLCFGAHVLMENRHGLCAAITVHDPIEKPEPAVALELVEEIRQLHEARVTTVGADKGYHQKGFVQGCRERGISPPVACKDKQKVAGLRNQDGPRSEDRDAAGSWSDPRICVLSAVPV